MSIRTHCPTWTTINWDWLWSAWENTILLHPQLHNIHFCNKNCLEYRPNYFVIWVRWSSSWNAGVRFYWWPLFWKASEIIMRNPRNTNYPNTRMPAITCLPPWACPLPFWQSGLPCRGLCGLFPSQVTLDTLNESLCPHPCRLGLLCRAIKIRKRTGNTKRNLWNEGSSNLGEGTRPDRVHLVQKSISC